MSKLGVQSSKSSPCFFSPLATLAMAVVMLAMATLSGCGGSGAGPASSASPAAQPSASVPAATSTFTPPLAPPIPSVAGGVTYYFSDCQAGASAGCVAGNDGNAGLNAASPKRTLSSVDYNVLQAGSQLLLARGGAWANVSLNLRNLNVTPTSPLVLDSYAPSWGGTAPPKLVSSPGASTIVFGSYADTVADGGYTIRNLKFDGGGVAQWGFFIIGETRNVTIENNEITGYEIAVHFQNMGTTGNTGLTIRNNAIHHNREMGMLGDANDMVMEGNTIEANNFSGSALNHGLYLGGHARNGAVRNNRFLNNSAVQGVCTGGNLTVHGQWDGLVIEGNRIEQDASRSGCWGISVTAGYTAAEVFSRVVLRNNEIINLECAICVNAAPGILIEGNLFRSNQSGLPTAVSVSTSTPPDDPGLNPIARNNTVCFVDPNPGVAPIRFLVGGGTQMGTVYRTGADATTGVCAR